MVKIDIHTHILPENLNELTETFTDKRFLRIKMIDEKNAVLKKDNQSFRKVKCNCWHVPERIKDCSKTNIDIQVLSTIPVLFSYWANDKDGANLGKGNWELAKQKEKQRESVLDGVPIAFPALLRARRVQEKAASVGFDWNNTEQVFNKVEEEVQELKEALEI